jgi:5-methylcytosine-specific restriction endonuclease McrA
VNSGVLAEVPRPPRPKDVLQQPILLLNRYFAPLSVTTARRGLVLLFGGTALALDERGDSHDFCAWRRLPVRDDDDGLPVVNGALRLPRVMHLQRYDRAPRIGVRLTRRNLLLRDDYRCQYCGKQPGTRELNVDHVLPRSRGGRETWENLVISCRGCNLRKGKQTPAEAKMHLLAEPRRPYWTVATQIALATPTPFSEWRPFLG